MINWDRIIESHVISAFRVISHKWWGIDIQFYDKYGRCKSGNIPLKNHFCQVMQSTKKKDMYCSRNYKETLKGISQTNAPFFYKCYAGVKGVAVPIFAQRNYVGAMIGSGIKLSRDSDFEVNECMEELERLGFNREELKNYYDEAATVQDNSEERLLDMMSLVAKDVTVFYEMLLEKEEAIKRQMEIRDTAYRERYCGMIGVSAAMKKIFGTLEVFKDSESSVLVDGESGTGKELIAAAIHYNSPRRDKMFVIQNCSTFSDTLLISELFGHEKGSFTGAISEKKGLFEVADGGTLFLDEIGDMRADTLAKLLRVLEDGTFYRVGGTVPKKVDVRVIAATNKDIKKLIEQGLFRMDLFYRINTLHITMPPLRERKEDIAPLVDHFLEIYAEANNTEKKSIDHDVITVFMDYNWPGNIRELKNLIEHLIILSGRDSTISVKHLPAEMIKNAKSEDSGKDGEYSPTLRDALKSLEKQMIEKELRKTRWNKTASSRKLGISRASLNIKIAEYNIQP